MDLFTLVHVIISIVAIGFGFVVVGGWMAGRQFRQSTIWFITLTALTSVTGFFFPIKGPTPGLVVGTLSLVLLAAALIFHAKRTTFILCAITTLYLNFFVLVAQLFQKVPEMKALAPTQSEPPFAVTQAVVFALFIVFALAALKGFRPTKQPVL